MASGEPNFYAHVTDSNSWIDVFGLTPGIITYPITGATSSHVPQSGGWQTGINRAWAQEKALLEAGHSGTRPWSAPEIDLIKSTPNSQLNSVMTNEGYTGHHITSKNGTMALEVKTYNRYITVEGKVKVNEVPFSPKIRQQVLKDVYLRDNVKGYDPRWIFLDALSSLELSTFLSKNRIISVIHQ